MSWRSAIVLILIVAFAFTGCGEIDNEVPDDSALAGETAQAVTLLSETDSEIVFRVMVSEPEVDVVQTQFGEFARLTIPDWNYSGLVGDPALPAIRRIVSLPVGAEVSVSAEAMIVDRLVLDYQVMPNQLPVEKIPGALERNPFMFNQETYQTDAYLVGRLAELVEEGMMRNHRLGLLEISPIDYNPVTNELLVARELVITIELRGGDVAATRQMAQEQGSAAFDALMLSQSINKGEKWNLFTAPQNGAGYLIIYASTFSGSGALSSFVSRKQADGWSVTTVDISQVGGTVIGIRDYIVEYYNSHPALTFVLLVGDTNTIPNAVGFGSNSPATDLYYSCMNDADYYPDLLIGRFPVRNESQLANVVNKINAYETSAAVKRATFMASTDNHNISENTHNVVIQYFLSPYSFTVDKLYTYTYGATTQQVKNAINAGTNFAIYSGHGDVTLWADGPYFTQADVRSLTNTKYPFVGSFACLTGKYQADECFAETWLRDDHGAVAMVASSVTSYWSEDDWFEKGMFLGMYNFPWAGYPDQVWAASANLCGKFAVWRMSNWGGGSSQRYFEMYNLFGDPSLEIFNH